MNIKIISVVVAVVLIVIILVAAYFSTRPKIAANSGGEEDKPEPKRTYTFYPGMDSGDFDGNIRNASEVLDNVPGLMAVCDATPECVAFNTNGWLKKKVAPQGTWAKWTTNPNKGLYILNK